VSGGGDDPAHARPSPAHGPFGRARRQLPSSGGASRSISVMRYDASDVVERDGVPLDECVALLDNPVSRGSMSTASASPRSWRDSASACLHPLAVEDVFNVPQRPSLLPRRTSG
jgi:hypothetical protein